MSRGTKKIRGHKRHWRDIDDWIARCLPSDDPADLKERDYIKIWVAPWGNLQMNNRKQPEPRGESKAKILKGLIHIYDTWKKALDSTNEPYYLKIWLYDQRFSKSQVVFARGPYLDFYENTFYEPDEASEFNPMSFGKKGTELSEFTADYRWDEEHYFRSDIGEPEDYITLKDYYESVRWFEKELMKNPRITPASEDLKEETYSLRMGDVYLLSRT